MNMPEIGYVVQKGREIRVFSSKGMQLHTKRLYSDSDQLVGFTSKTYSIKKGAYNPSIYTYDAKGFQIGTPINVK